MPYLNVATHIPTTPDEGLMGRKGGNGFPYVVFMDHEGTVLTDRIWPKDKAAVEEAQKTADQEVSRLNQMRDKLAKTPDDKVLAATLALEVGMRYGGSRTVKELAELAKTPGVDAALVKRFAVFETGSKVQEVMSRAMKIMQAEGRDKALAMLMAEYLKMFKAGVRLEPGHALQRSYLSIAMQSAVRGKDFDTAAAVVKAARENAAGITDSRTSQGAQNMAESLNRALQNARDAAESSEEDG